ncbi:MAG: heme exporter protein CcmB [Pseudomonadota bacterium]
MVGVLLKREIALAYGRGSNIALPLVFFLALVILFPFGIGPDPETLSLVGPAVLWVGPLLGTLLALEAVFQPDVEDGTLDVLLCGPVPLELVVAVKALAVWISTAIPLTIAAPVFGLMLNMDGTALSGTALSLLAGTPALAFFGTMGAAVTAPLRRAGMLLAIIIVPLMVPVLIFGVGAAAGYGDTTLPFRAPFLLLCAFSLFALIIAPLAGAAALRTLRS